MTKNKTPCRLLLQHAAGRFLSAVFLFSGNFGGELKPAVLVIVYVLRVKALQYPADAGQPIAVFACGRFCCGNAVFCDKNRQAGVPDGKKEAVSFQDGASNQAFRIRPSVLQQMQKKGGIYRLPLTYTILTYAADPEQLSDNTPETVLQACEQGGEELYPFARNADYSSLLAARCAVDYVDAAQGTCNFECDSFYAQLALLRRQKAALDTLPENLDVAATCDGLLYYYVILSADSIVYQPGRYGYPELKQSVYYAYPSDHDGGCQLEFGSLLSINTQSEQKSGAWAFLSYLLSDACQQSVNYLPVSDTVLQEQFKQLLTEETVTQEDIDTFYALVDHAQKPDYPTEPIEQIIEEEMAAYLDGAIDEKTTAERIQSRAGLYLMEQKVE